MVGVYHWLKRVPGLEAFFGQPVVYPPFRDAALSSVVIWGAGARTGDAVRLARRHDIPCFRVGPGLLGKMGRSGAPLSILVDDRDLRTDRDPPGPIERCTALRHTPEQLERARRIIGLWRQGRISFRNDAREDPSQLPESYVVLLDQPAAEWPGPRKHLLATMCHAAAKEHPDCPVVVLPVPGGYLSKRALPRMGTAGILKLRGDPHPSGILEGARAVYTVGSHLGFEALLWGVPVRTFGAPFYAGWGLTSDQLSGIKHRSPAVLEDLVHAALIECSRYRHPETGEQCDVENIIEWLALQRRMRERFPRTLYAAGFSPRKSRFVRDFLQGSTVHFVPHESKAPPDGTLVRWGPQDAWHGSAHRDIVCCEDGFLRSVGLGAGLAQPLSWALDRTGIYYDSGAPSDIELSLANAQFDSRLLDRAVRLRQAIVQGGVTKYNVGVQAWVRPPGRRNVILVPGQVERDAAIRLGCPGIRTNLELLQSVRAANPEAYIVYKPHPDIVAGLRAAGRGEDQAAEWCDEQLMDASLAQLFPEVDEVHVLTSLAGFEALLREKKVVCHGQPFYSGWGLTTDMVPVARRARVLSLDVLVAAALILYPTYISRVTGTFTTPERVIEELRQWREERARRRPGSVENLARRGLYAFLRWKE